jgi:AcrR family transcriptional regulator
MEPRRTQAARSRAARDQIVQAALTVFSLKGYTAASMEDISLAAGCSKGGLYHHFRTKSAVLASVVDLLADRGALLPPTPAVATSASGTGRVLLEAWSEAARDPGLRDRLREGYERMLSDRMTAAFDLSALLRIGTLIQLLTRGEGLDAERVATQLGIEKAA